jgi:hypothetical protein
VTSVWYFADGQAPVGPLSLRELQETLPTLSNPAQVLVWRDGLPDWMAASEVPELRKHALKPSPIPESPPRWVYVPKCAASGSQTRAVTIAALFGLALMILSAISSAMNAGYITPIDRVDPLIRKSLLIGSPIWAAYP